VTIVGDGFSTGLTSGPIPRVLQDAWRTVAHQRLNRSLATAFPVPFNDCSRIIFFSDLHRGDGSAGDKFLVNRPLFLATLRRYFDEGYIYIEVGDGDELWVNGRFEEIHHTHRLVFEMLHAFNREQRLFLLIGNHDTFNSFQHQQDKDGIPTYQSLLLRHNERPLELLVLHGHHADLTSSRYYALTRLFCRSVWKRLQARTDIQTYEKSFHEARFLNDLQRRGYPLAGQGKRIEDRLIEWVAGTQHPLICGHTHQPAFPGQSNPPYFNSGSCISPGYLTGLELSGGELALVRWSFDLRNRPQRQLLARPRLIEHLSPGNQAGTR
jgi:UDP-2,3-diacylglucosamine pyrophosphatase LpxH